MFGTTRKLLIAALFTIFLVVFVNFAWWVFFGRTEGLLERQLSRRLTAAGSAAAWQLDESMLRGLADGDLAAYLRATEILENIRRSDSLSEVFVVDAAYRYLATTSADNDTSYFLAALNAPYIDSLLFGIVDQPIVTPSYKTGRVYLKSAFVPLFDSTGFVLGVLGVEASVDYSHSLQSLKKNLLLSTGVSLSGGLVLGILFLLVQQRLGRAQQLVFLNETHAYLGRMVAVVSHEIKNPLMIIRASAERLRKKSRDEETAYIVDEVDRLNEIVSGYLSFASGAGESQSYLGGQPPARFDLSDLLNGLRKHFDEKYTSHQVVWIAPKPRPGLKLVGYRRPLRQVLLNLLVNGAEACLASGRPIEVGLKVETRGASTAIIVTDRGQGIPRRQLKGILEPFHTTRQSGSGLGLYVSKKIVEEMNGQLIIESVEGKGTVVSVLLPNRLDG